MSFNHVIACMIGVERGRGSGKRDSGFSAFLPLHFPLFVSPATQRFVAGTLAYNIDAVIKNIFSPANVTV